MDTADLLADGFARVRDDVHAAVADLTPEELTTRVEPGANTVAWLVWHLARVQDDHVADVAGREQLWTAQDWHGRFGLPFGPAETGYGHSAEQVAQVRVADPALLTGYYDAVHAATLEWIADLAGADLDRVVDKRWTPHVTLGVRLVSVINDDTQHAGQAALLRGILLRRR